MKISLGEKVNYLAKCPYCGTPRAEGAEKCVNCGKSLLEITEKDTSVPDEDKDVALYQARSDKSASENLKELKGKSKFRYFMDYYFGKVVFGLIIAALVGGLLYTFLKPRQTPVMYATIVVSPFTPTGYDQVMADLEDMLITDPRHQNVVLDICSSLVADYNSGMAFMMHMAAGEVDLLICSKDELKYQVNSEALASVSKILSKELLDKIPDSAKITVVPTFPQDDGSFIEGEEEVYALNIEEFLKRINGFDTSNKYCVAITSITDKKENIEKVIKYMFDIK